MAAYVSSTSGYNNLAALAQASAGLQNLAAGNGGWVGVPYNPNGTIYFTPNTNVIPSKPSALDIVKKINADGIAKQQMEKLLSASQ